MANFKRHRPRKAVRCVICTPRALGRDTLATRQARDVVRELRADGWTIHAR